MGRTQSKTTTRVSGVGLSSLVLFAPCRVPGCCPPKVAKRGSSASATHGPSASATRGSSASATRGSIASATRGSSASATRFQCLVAAVPCDVGFLQFRGLAVSYCCHLTLCTLLHARLRGARGSLTRLPPQAFKIVLPNFPAHRSPSVGPRPTASLRRSCCRRLCQSSRRSPRIRSKTLSGISTGTSSSERPSSPSRRP
jgi:hypothetical protein